MAPGEPAAPAEICLPLLPSGPDGVHRSAPHRARHRPQLRKRSVSEGWVAAGGTLRRGKGTCGPMVPRWERGHQANRPGRTDWLRSLEEMTPNESKRLNELKDMAERVGFEPTVRGLPAHALSKRAPSASRTPLRTLSRRAYCVSDCRATAWPYAATGCRCAAPCAFPADRCERGRAR